MSKSLLLGFSTLARAFTTFLHTGDMKRVGEVFDVGDSSLSGQLGCEESVSVFKEDQSDGVDTLKVILVC